MGQATCLGEYERSIIVDCEAVAPGLGLKKDIDRVVRYNFALVRQSKSFTPMFIAKLCQLPSQHANMQNVVLIDEVGNVARYGTHGPANIVERITFFCEGVGEVAQPVYREIRMLPRQLRKPDRR
jgi:hypothetical protein